MSMISRSISYMFLFSILFWVVACAPKSDPIEELRAEVMKYHDEAMPKLKDIEDLGNKLYNIQELNAYKAWPDDRKEELQVVLNNLGDAKKSMWDWMYAYVEPEETTPQDQKIAYFNSELEKVKEMHGKIFGSIEAANAFMVKYGIG